MWCFRSFTSPDGSAQDDRKPAPFSMTRGGCIYGDKECHSEHPLVVILSVSEESGEEGRGLRTANKLICILLKYKLLQKSIVRGPCFFEGTTNKVILHYIVPQGITKS
jgi:hypothetical protein